MELWGWIVAYVILFALLQLLIYLLYVRRGDSGSVSASIGGDGRRSAGGATPQHSPFDRGRPGDSADVETNDDTRTCPHCGTANEFDPTFTYCRGCVRPLGM